MEISITWLQNLSLVNVSTYHHVIIGFRFIDILLMTSGMHDETFIFSKCIPKPWFKMKTF